MLEQTSEHSINIKKLLVDFEPQIKQFDPVQYIHDDGNSHDQLLRKYGTVRDQYELALFNKLCLSLHILAPDSLNTIDLSTWKGLNSRMRNLSTIKKLSTTHVKYSSVIPELAIVRILAPRRKIQVLKDSMKDQIEEYLISIMTHEYTAIDFSIYALLSSQILFPDKQPSW